MTLFPWLLAVVPLLGLPRAAGTLTVSDGSAVYVRGDFELERVTLGVENAPRVDLAVDFRRLELALRYGPRFVGGDVAGPGDPAFLLLHEGTATLRYSGKRGDVALGQSLRIGEQYLGKLPQTTAVDPIAPADPTTSRATPLANADSLRIRAQTTSGLASYFLTRRHRLEGGASYTISGGANAAARALQPSLRTIEFSAGVRARLTRNDDLGSVGSAFRTRTSNDYQHWVATLQESWSTRISERTSSALMLGIGYRDSQAPGGKRTRAPLPVGSASVIHALRIAHSRGTLSAGAALSPFINLLTGEFQSSLQGSVSSSLQKRDTRLDLTVDALQTLPLDAPRATRVIGGGLRTTHQVARWISLFAGLRVQHQHIADTTLSLALQWAITGGCALESLPFRF